MVGCIVIVMFSEWDALMIWDVNAGCMSLQDINGVLMAFGWSSVLVIERSTRIVSNVSQSYIDRSYDAKLSSYLDSVYRTGFIAMGRKGPKSMSRWVSYCVRTPSQAFCSFLRVNPRRMDHVIPLSQSSENPTIHFNNHLGQPLGHPNLISNFTSFSAQTLFRKFRASLTELTISILPERHPHKYCILTVFPGESFQAKSSFTESLVVSPSSMKTRPFSATGPWPSMNPRLNVMSSTWSRDSGVSGKHADI